MREEINMDSGKTSQRIDHGLLENLLSDLAAQQNYISIRLELNGEMWMEHFSSVLVFSQRAFLLTHMPTRSVVNIPDVNLITGFEIDHPHKLFLPYQCYGIDPVSGRIKIRKDGLLHA